MVDHSPELEEILARCIEAIETGGWSVEDCLSRYPAYRPDLEPLLRAVVRLQEARAVAPSLAFKKHASERLRARLQASKRAPVTAKRAPSSAGGRRWTLRRLVTWPALIMAALLALGTTSGIVYASDGAVPGDPLYGLDQAVEQVQLSLARSPLAAARLQLGFASERLAEADQLAGKGDTPHVEEALAGYGQAISGIVGLINSTQGADQEALVNLLDKGLATGSRGQCGDAGVNPHGAALASLYGVSEEEIADWFCAGFGYGEIDMAYSLSQDMGVPVDEIFAMRSSGLGWGKIMRELGAKHGGKPDNTPGNGPPTDHPGNGQGHDDNPGNGPPDGTPGNGQDHGDKPDKGTPDNPGRGHDK